MLFAQVSSVEIGVLAVFVPPGTSPYHSAASTSVIVMISILVLKAMLSCSGIKESPAVPEYEPTMIRYFACSSPMLNLPYLACTLTPFQSSSSTRKNWV